MVLMSQVDDGYRTWRKPSLLLFGASDPFISVKSAFDFLESKRTNMRLATASAKVNEGPVGSLDHTSSMLLDKATALP
jgi:hypothetical protein